METAQTLNILDMIVKHIQNTDFSIILEDDTKSDKQKLSHISFEIKSVVIDVARILGSSVKDTKYIQKLLNIKDYSKFILENYYEEVKHMEEKTKNVKIYEMNNRVKEEISLIDDVYDKLGDISNFTSILKDKENIILDDMYNFVHKEVEGIIEDELDNHGYKDERREKARALFGNTDDIVDNIVNDLLDYEEETSEEI